MLTVHHLNNSRSQRVLWLLEELEVPYEIKKYDRDANQQAPKELLAINPLGKSPVITDGDVTLAESGAIVEYLISKYDRNGKFSTLESGYLDNLYFTHYAEGSLMPLLIQKIIFGIVPKKAPFLVRPLVSIIFGQLEKMIIQPEYKRHYELIDAHLNKVTSWFAGGDHPTSADFQMAFPLEAIVTTAPDLASQKMKEYVKRVQERPAYKRGIEKGGPYAYAV
ncbi:thioredoxin-like protein [Collybia nuda]|uniref:glutathione transferase n=1 Tax=Collybia nuda TaxID=64659 RepID=A0A9P5XSE7_9AGAR|nr:thioredoxin-like protein [Collybia nuda]